MAREQIVVSVFPVDGRAGVFEASVGGRVLCRSRTPLLTAARVLIAEGYDPDAQVVMRHTGYGADALRARLGVAAKLTVAETKFGAAHFRRWQSFAGLDQKQVPVSIKGSLRIEQNGAPTTCGYLRSPEPRQAANPSAIKPAPPSAAMRISPRVIPRS